MKTEGENEWKFLLGFHSRDLYVGKSNWIYIFGEICEVFLVNKGGFLWEI
ncbi:hypothetical protein bcere0022_44610 [Bacillus cereus Rock3-44]|nr:hypothetical protein bcere0022_44610 [Bacillus cereus Rock3-44]